LLGTVSVPGNLAPDHRTWRGATISGLFPDRAPVDLGPPPQGLFLRAASRSGLFVTQDATSLQAREANGLATTLYTAMPAMRVDVIEVSDDGTVVAVLERSYGPEDGRLLVYRRVTDCQSTTCLPGDLPFAE